MEILLLCFYGLCLVVIIGGISFVIYKIYTGLPKNGKH